jgi:hypothetical protein
MVSTLLTVSNIGLSSAPGELRKIWSRGGDVPSDTTCAGYLGHPFRKLAVCNSPIFLFFHFPLVNDRENRGMENRSPVFRE